jgi:chorismate mutase
MATRAIRGAITVVKNSEAEILKATGELLQAIVISNNLKVKNIVSAFFTVTKDLNAQFPAVAARKLGWKDVPMLCSYEIDVRNSLRKCIRVLITFNTWKSQKRIRHQYLGQAVKLRPDINR